MHRGGVSGDMLPTQDNEKLFSYDDLSLLGPQIYCTDLKIAHHVHAYYLAYLKRAEYESSRCNLDLATGARHLRCPINQVSRPVFIQRCIWSKHLLPKSPKKSVL